MKLNKFDSDVQELNSFIDLTINYNDKLIQEIIEECQSKEEINEQFHILTQRLIGKTLKSEYIPINEILDMICSGKFYSLTEYFKARIIKAYTNEIEGKLDFNRSPLN